MLPPTPTPTQMSKPLTPSPPPPNKYNWYTKEYVSLMENDGVTPLSLLMLPLLCHLSPPLLSVPYLPRSRCRCHPLACFYICLSSAATSVLVEPLSFSLLPHYMSSCLDLSPSSYLRHPRISSSIQVAPPPQKITPTPPPTPSLSISLLYIYIYISIYITSLILSLLSLSLNLYIYISLTSYSPDLLLTFSLYIFEISIISLSYYLYLTHTISNYFCLIQSLHLPNRHYAPQQTQSRHWSPPTFPSPPPSEIGLVGVGGLNCC